APPPRKRVPGQSKAGHAAADKARKNPSLMHSARHLPKSGSAGEGNPQRPGPRYSRKRIAEPPSDLRRACCPPLQVQQRITTRHQKRVTFFSSLLNQEAATIFIANKIGRASCRERE